MDANQLRAACTGVLAARSHEVVPSASLIPHDPTVLVGGGGSPEAALAGGRDPGRIHAALDEARRLLGAP